MGFPFKNRAEGRIATSIDLGKADPENDRLNADPGSMVEDSDNATVGRSAGRESPGREDGWRRVGKGTGPARGRPGTTGSHRLLADYDWGGDRSARAARRGGNRPSRVGGPAAATPVGAADQRQNGRGDEKGQYETFAEHGNTSREGASRQGWYSRPFRDARQDRHRPRDPTPVGGSVHRMDTLAHGPCTASSTVGARPRRFNDARTRIHEWAR